MQKTLLEMIEALKINNKINFVQESLTSLKKWKHLNATTITFEDEALKNYQNINKNKQIKQLKGIPYAAKDNFNVKNSITTASSKILANFVSPINATVIKKLNNQQAILIGKTTLDELGMGGSGIFASTGVVLNPWDKTRITGGSSSGSAALVAAGIVPFALATDTGDSTRKPASYCGIVGYKPTYGLISRYGVIPFAPSLDTVGYMTRSIADCAYLLDCLAEWDVKDFTSVKLKNQMSFHKTLMKDSTLKNYKICYFKAIHEKLNSKLQTKYDDLFKTMRQKGAIIKEYNFSIDLLITLWPIYQVISFAESNSTHSNLDGIKFGKRAKGKNYREVMKNSRTKYIGKEVQKRFVIGSYCLNEDNQKELFFKAKQIRQLFSIKMKKIFSEYDAVILPGSASTAPLIKEVLHNKNQMDSQNNFKESALIIPNLIGSPSLSLPLGFIDNLPINLTVNTAPFQDQKCLNISYEIEKITGLMNLQVIKEKKKGI